MKNSDCLKCPIAVWNYCWITCPISDKTYEDSSTLIPWHCPYKKMTLEEVKRNINLRYKLVLK